MVHDMKHLKILNSVAQLIWEIRIFKKRWVIFIATDTTGTAGTAVLPLYQGVLDQMFPPIILP